MTEVSSIYGLANETGVSASVASRACNGRGRIGSTIRQYAPADQHLTPCDQPQVGFVPIAVFIQPLDEWTARSLKLLFEPMNKPNRFPQRIVLSNQLIEREPVDTIPA